MEPALSLTGLRKVYSNGVEALKGISLRVERGDFFALLGPNGAGKSTTINIIIDLVRKSSGEVSVFGLDAEKQRGATKKLIGVVPQEFNFNVFEKVFDIVVDHAGYYGVSQRTARDRAERYLKQLDLWGKRNEQAQTLSGGMKRRLMIARALAHEPQLLILDEPTAGVDVETRRDMWEFIRELNTEGRTIILTTHYLEEAETLCRNIAIIDEGDIIENTSMKELVRRVHRERYVFDTRESIRGMPPPDHFSLRVIDDSTVEVEVSERETLSTVFRYFLERGLDVVRMNRKTSRLEELFLDLVGKHRDDR